MGAVGRRFGRNVPLEHTFPDTANLLIPNPRVVSRELMTRDKFQPATILNLLAAAWIQFMVHDWFVHERSKTEFIEIPTPPGDDLGEPSMRVPRTVPDPAPAGSTRPPAYANLNSHWWDASQIYGCDAATAAKLRTKIGGKLRIEPTGLLPVDPETGVHFTRLHRQLVDRPRHAPHAVHARAQLHLRSARAPASRLERRAAVRHGQADQLGADGEDPHRRVDAGDRAAPDHHAGHERELVGASRAKSSRTPCEFLDDKELHGGIVGSTPSITPRPYSLTEEFVAVYRMHPLMPDDVAFHSLVTGRLLEKQPLNEIAGRKTPAIAERVTMPDLFYSFGTCHPGAVTLHNYPRHLQNLRRDNGEQLDLAAVDILRDRERGVPRYNQFRRLLHKEPVKSFDELTDNAEWRKQIKQVYNDDLEKRRSDDRSLRRAAAGGVRLQRDGVPRVHPDGVAPPEERSLLHGRLPAGDLHGVRLRLHPEEHDAGRAATALSAARAGVLRGQERVPAVDGNQRAR